MQDEYRSPHLCTTTTILPIIFLLLCFFAAFVVLKNGTILSIFFVPRPGQGEEPKWSSRYKNQRAGALIGCVRLHL